MQEQLRVLIIGLALVTTLSSCDQSANGESQPSDTALAASLPEEIKRLVFEESRFAQPIVLELPVDDLASRERLEHRLPQRGRRLALTPIISTDGFRNINKYVLSYLVDNELAQVESHFVQWTYSENEYHFLLYTPTFTGLPDTDNVSERYPFRPVLELPIGRRVMESIDYTNTYEQAIMGVSLDIWAIRFTYSLVTTTSLPKFPEVTQSFEGRARAYLDPDDGQWKLDQLELEDRAVGEYVRVIGERYPRFEPTPPPEVTQSGSVSGSVVSAAGNPIPNTSVQLRTSPLARLSTTQRGDLVDQRLNTDASGRFQFEDIPPGRYVLLASPDGRLVQAQVRVTGGTEVERDIRRDGPSAVSSPDRDLQDRVRTAEQIELNGPVAQQPCDAAENGRVRSSGATDPDLGSLEFRNAGEHELRVYWLDTDGQQVHYNTLRPGSRYLQRSYVLHAWLITDAADNCLSAVVYGVDQTGRALPGAEDATVTVR